MNFERKKKSLGMRREWKIDRRKIERDIKKKCFWKQAVPRADATTVIRRQSSSLHQQNSNNKIPPPPPILPYSLFLFLSLDTHYIHIFAYDIVKRYTSYIIQLRTKLLFKLSYLCVCVCECLADCNIWYKQNFSKKHPKCIDIAKCFKISLL